MKILLVISMLIVGLIGCSSLSLKDPVTKMGFQYAIGKAIEQSDDPQRLAQQVIEEAEKFKAFLDVQRIPLTELKQGVIQRIQARGWSPSDTMLAMVVLETVEDEISMAILDGRIPEGQVTRVNEFLDSVITAAVWYQ